MEFKALIPTLEFTPTSYDEYMQPYILAETAYQQRKKELDDRDEILAKYLPYINDSTPEAKRLYDAAQQQLQRNLEQLGRKGWNLNPQPLIDFKKQYRETNARLEKASADLAEQMKADKEAVAKDPTMYIAYRDKSGSFVKPNIDNMLLDDTTRHFVSGKDVQANAAKSAAALSERTKAAFANMYKTPNDEVGYYSVTQGKMAGVSSKVMMDWMMRPDDFKKEINDYLKSVKAFGGKGAADKMSALFSGDFRRAMDSVLDMTDYDNMTDADKLRINEHLWSGAYQGLSYDETVQKNIQQYYHPTPTPTGGGGGKDIPPIPVISPPTIEQVYNPAEEGEISVEQGRHNIEALKNFFGFDNSGYGDTGQITFRDSDKFSVPGGLRGYGWESSYGNTNKAGDDFIDNEAVLADETNPDGIKDFFVMFDENGALLSPADFVSKNHLTLADTYTDDYWNKQSANESYGAAYRTFIRQTSGGWDERQAERDAASFGAAGLSDTNEDNIAVSNIRKQYNKIKEAVLDAYDISGKTRDELQKSDSKFAQFIKDKNITRNSLREAISDLHDKYFNVSDKMPYLRFSQDQEGIVKDVLKTTLNSDNEYTLNLVTDAKQYTFVRKQVNGKKIKELKITPGEVESIAGKKLFTDPEGKNSYECQYIIPVDPSQGLLIQFPSGQRALLSPKQLGGLYPKEYLCQLAQKKKEYVAARSDAERQLKELYKKSELTAEDAATAAALQKVKEECESGIIDVETLMVDTLRDKMSASFKNNQQ